MRRIELGSMISQVRLLGFSESFAMAYPLPKSAISRCFAIRESSKISPNHIFHLKY